MKLALCTHFMDAPFWSRQIQDASADMNVSLDEYSDAENILNSHQRFDAVVVALKGVLGLQTVRSLRESGMDLPLIWIADEDSYFSFAYRYQVSSFLLENDDPAVLRGAMIRLNEVVA
ncbi:MAG: hypothetical protein J6A76_01760 [Oscillospiraceae bacterium]|nr:hypothetical protein [Oscillospiraceae bacterium]